MFELGRGLKKLFTERGRRPHDGLTAGDSSLLELLDLNLLTEEARAADVAAARLGEADKPRRRLEAAIAWREVARRTGDAVALRKAAALAETAAAGYEAARRHDGFARARAEQAFCALLGAEIFGDPGLDAAAEVAFREARTQCRSGATAALADIGLAAIAGRRGLEKGDAVEARAISETFAAPIAALEALARRTPSARALAAEARLARADLLCGWGARLQDADLLQLAVDDADAAVARLDSAYEPITLARALAARGQALVLLGETTGDVGPIADGAEAVAGALDQIPRDHSPLDWARCQIALGQGLQALGEAADDPRAFEQSVLSFDRALLVLKTSSLPLRGLAASARALSLARNAELTGDLAILDAAQAAMKMELVALTPRKDPVGWALAQLHLARLYEARTALTGIDRGERAAALTALDAALDVFAEHGLRSLSIQATEAVERLKVPGQAGAWRLE